MSFFFRWIRWGRLTAMVCAVGMVSVTAHTQEPAATFAVHGVVRNSVTHEPIARALVDAQQDAALTDNEGRFELHLAKGQANLSPRRPGYVAHNGFNSVEVGENTPELSLSLTPPGMVAGHISLSTGEDAGGIRVSAYRQITQRGHHSWQIQGNAMSDSEGRFHFPNLIAPASYVLVAAASVDQPAGGQNTAKTSGYGPAFYPDGSETSATNLLAVTPGQQSSVEMNVSREPFYSVTIQVRGATDARGFSAQVHDASGLAGDFPTELVGEKHMLTTKLPAGRYYAEVTTYGGAQGGTQSYGRIDFTVKGGSLQGLSVECLPLNPVLVRVRKEFTQNESAAGSGLIASISPSAVQSDGREVIDPGMNLTLVSQDGQGRVFGGLSPAANSEGGTLFQVQGAIPGTYWVTASAFQGYIHTLTSGGVDLATEPITLGLGNATAPIEAVLRNDGGTIKGTVRQSPQEKAAYGIRRNVSIYAIPLFASPSTPGQSGVMGGGDFAIGNLAPGSYRVVALDVPVEMETLEPEVRTRYLSKGETVSVEPNGTASVSLDVVGADDSGEPVE